MPPDMSAAIWATTGLASGAGLLDKVRAPAAVHDSGFQIVAFLGMETGAARVVAVRAETVRPTVVQFDETVDERGRDMGGRNGRSGGGRGGRWENLSGMGAVESSVSGSKLAKTFLVLLGEMGFEGRKGKGSRVGPVAPFLTGGGENAGVVQDGENKRNGR